MLLIIFTKSNVRFAMSQCVDNKRSMSFDFRLMNFAEKRHATTFFLRLRRVTIIAAIRSP